MRTEIKGDEQLLIDLEGPNQILRVLATVILWEPSSALLMA